jgi:tellurite resistance protein
MNAAQRQQRSSALSGELPNDLGAGASALKANASSDPQAARLHAMLEVAYLTASADDQVSDEEIQHLVANVQAWVGSSLDPAFLADLFGHLGAELAREGFQARLKAVAKVLDEPSRRDAYKLACVTALCDNEVHDDELKILGGIADVFGIPAAEAQATFDKLDAALTAL